jgi:HTH-type transcriptional regulator / antitoxin HigA
MSIDVPLRVMASRDRFEEAVHDGLRKPVDDVGDRIERIGELLARQARLIAAYEERKWPRRSPSLADMIRHLMDQHGLTRADMVPILGTPSRVSEVLSGKKGLSMAMVQRLRARFRVPADLLLPPPKKASASRATKRVAA